MVANPIVDQIVAEDLPKTSVAIQKYAGNGEEMVIPAGTDSRVFGATHLNIVHEGRGNLYLYKCKVDRIVCKSGTHIATEECVFTGTIDLRGTTGTITGSVVDADELAEVGCIVKLRDPFMNISEGSDIRFSRVNFRDMREILEIKDSSVRFSRCRTLTEFNKCIVGENTKLKISKSKFFSTYQCVSLSGASFLIVSQSHLKGYEAMCLALSGVKGRVSDCTFLTTRKRSDPKPEDPEDFIFDDEAQTRGLFGAGAVVRLSGGSSMAFRDTDLEGSERLHDYGIKCDLGSTAVFSSSSKANALRGGDWPAIECNGVGSSVTVINYRYILTSNRPAVSASDYGRVYIVGAQAIESAAKEAFYAESGGTIQVENSGEATGKTYGARLVDGGQLTITGPFDMLKGVTEDAISAAESSQVVLTEVTALIGQKAGCRLSDGSRLTLLNTTTVQGLTEEGIVAEENCHVLARFAPILLSNAAVTPRSTLVPSGSSDSPTIQGQTTGVSISKESRCVLYGYKDIIGLVEDAVSVGEDSRLSAFKIEKLSGQKAGVRIGSGARIALRDIPTIEGLSEEAVVGETDDGISISDVDLIEGVKGGIKITDRGQYLQLSNIKTIHTVEGGGIDYEGKSVSISNIDLIKTDSGSGSDDSGIILRGCRGKLADLRIDAYYHGMIVTTSSSEPTRASDIDATSVRSKGLVGPHGLDVISSTFVGRKCVFNLDGLVANGSLTLSSSQYLGALIVNGGSSATLDDCFINGHFHIFDSSYDFKNVLGTGEQKATNSSGVTRNYTQTATYESTNEASTHVNPTIGGAVTLVTSTMNISRGTVSAQLAASGSTVSAETVAFGSGVDVSGSSTAELSSCTVAGAVTAAASALDLRACNAGGVDLNGACSLVAHSGNLGVVNVSGSSAALFSTNCTVMGIEAQSPIPCGPGDVVIVGTGHWYKAFDNQSVEWYKKPHKIYSEDLLEILSLKRIYASAPDMTESISPPLKPNP